MSNWKSVFTLLLLTTALTSEGQYFKLLKGQSSPFDTAVAIQINRYRLETVKLKLADRLVDSLISEIKSLHRETSLDDSLHLANARTILILSKGNERKDSVNHVLQNNINAMAAIKPTPMFKQPATIGITILILLELIHLFAH